MAKKDFYKKMETKYGQYQELIVYIQKMEQNY